MGGRTQGGVSRLSMCPATRPGGVARGRRRQREGNLIVMSDELPTPRPIPESHRTERHAKQHVPGAEYRGPSAPTYPVGHPPRRTLPPDLASALWQARAESGLTNREVAERVGIDASYLSKLVRGSRCPSLVTAERLIDVLGLSEGEREALLDVAVADRGKSRPAR
jgi:DNA-binding XRE family transcriptional regulator